MRKIFGILGATAVGKSDIAYKIAQRLDCPLISADSMQIYKKFDIGTAKPSIEEQQKVKYYGIDIVDASLEFNSYKYVKYLEDEVLNIINNADDVPLIVGGTGLYFDSLLHPLDFRTDEFTFATRLEMTDLFNNKGIEPLKDILRKYNSDIDNKIDWNNTKRVIRAIEIYRSGGEPYANTLSCKSDKYENVLIVLERDRAELYKRINNRVDKMLNEGLVEEVVYLRTIYKDDCQAFSAIGYREVVAYLNMQYDYNTMVEKIKQDTRNYAKRQVTYFKRFKNAIHIEMDDTNSKDIIERCIRAYNVHK